MSKTKYEILSEKQKKVWSLHEQGLSNKAIAEQLGVSYNAVRETLKRIERRFREYDQYHEMDERDKVTIFLPLTRGEGKVIIEALQLLSQELESKVVHNVKSDWYGRLPYKSLVAADLLERAEIAVYGQKITPTSTERGSM